MPTPTIQRRANSGLLGAYSSFERPLVRVANAVTRRTFLHRIGTATTALTAVGLSSLGKATSYRSERLV